MVEQELLVEFPYFCGLLWVDNFGVLAKGDGQPLRAFQDIVVLLRFHPFLLQEGLSFFQVSDARSLH